MKLTLFFTDGVSLQTWNKVGVLARELALYTALQKRGIEIGFVTYGDDSDLQLISRLPGVDLRVNKSKLPLWLYKRGLRSAPPEGEIFKSNQVAGAEVGMAAARRAKAKFVARCGYLLSEFQERRFGKYSREAKDARDLESHVFAGADAVVLTTPVMLDSVRVRYAIPPEIMRVIPNYVETDRFKPVKREPNKKMRVGFVGRLDAQKNVGAFVDAVRDLDVEVRLIGYGPQRVKLEHQAENARAEYRFWGSIPNEDLPGLLNSCDLFVLPSLYEGHPKALLEAMACGLPVVGTRVQGTQEIIRDDQNGLLCETDSASIKEAVERLINDGEVRERLGRAARTFVEENFALERVVELEMKLLNHLAS